jgi:glucose-6-phosphate 1-epimerase
MPASISVNDLNDRFAIPKIARIVAGNGGLPKVQITSPSASAEIYLHGAQLTSWQPAGSSEVIFLSEHSRWEAGRAIRGGIPICFPWFRAKADNPQVPAHGFVRTKAWQLESVTHDQDSVVVTLATQTDEQSRIWWPHECRVIHRITIGQELRLELIVSNIGPVPFQFEEALHTYHRVGDVVNLSISGLDKVAFLDNRDSNREKLLHGDVHLTEATDNAYINTQNAVEIIDPTLHRRIHIAKQNSLTTIVWNPWKEDAAKLADLGDSEWQQFACVEASNILRAAVTLAPGQQHTMQATIHVTEEIG